MKNEKEVGLMSDRMWIGARVGERVRTLLYTASDDETDECDVEYVRADLLATVRAEEQTNFVNNIAAVLDGDDVEAFTALIMKAKVSPDLNGTTRSALKSEAEIRAEEREAMLHAVREFFSGLTSKQVNLDNLLSALTGNRK